MAHLHVLIYYLLHHLCQLYYPHFYPRRNLEHLAAHVALQRQQDGSAQVSYIDKVPLLSRSSAPLLSRECWAVTHTLHTTRSGCFRSSRITGTSLIASGRVPRTESTFSVLPSLCLPDG